MEHPREECLVVENTHLTLITQEVWDIVQCGRKNRHRPTKMEEQNWTLLVSLKRCSYKGTLIPNHSPRSAFKENARQPVLHRLTSRAGRHRPPRCFFPFIDPDMRGKGM